MTPNLNTGTISADGLSHIQWDRRLSNSQVPQRSCLLFSSGKYLVSRGQKVQNAFLVRTELSSCHLRKVLNYCKQQKLFSFPSDRHLVCVFFLCESGPALTAVRAREDKELCLIAALSSSKALFVVWCCAGGEPRRTVQRGWVVQWGSGMGPSRLTDKRTHGH